MKKTKLIIGVFLLTFYNSSFSLAQEAPESVTKTPEEMPINLSVEEANAIKQEAKDTINKTVQQTDERDRKRLMNVIEDIKRRMHKKSNLKLPPKERKKYRSRRVNYKNSEEFNDYLNSFFMDDLNKINPPLPQNTPNPDEEKEKTN